MGDEECVDCHEDEAEVHARTLHGKVDFEKWKTEGKGCESCHGPGSAHSKEAEDSETPKQIIAFKEEAPKGRMNVCLQCHRRDREREDFRRSEHAMSQIPCDECHQIHQAGVREAALKRSAPGLCYTCHIRIQAEFNLPERHKVPEGVIDCSDCHTAHSAANRVQLRREKDEACFNCHSELRGPWVFEHLSVYVEGCTICHKPHGSNNRHLLNYQEVASLCLQCHPNTPAFHNMRAIAGNFRNCTHCHVNIHGSNVSHVFFE
ncbi:MAG: DmsE family decaheme c-type cytochrome [Candidatus Tectomicrobia bacterium]|uniref:DmsE family decaheme c-type cytochrome n=1 Tax=Tectimicrobiota bacterium TaxID=2528274 RepID=A0A932FWC6_UNCTE|nr:DmsE family decaheme c-type cytochrome [Candidatus Tectomicrobia bacterium]